MQLNRQNGTPLLTEWSHWLFLRLQENLARNKILGKPMLDTICNYQA
jgi:hypothetical protein